MQSVKQKTSNFNALYKAMRDCEKGVSWKPSVIRYVHNGLLNTAKLSEELINGEYSMDKQVRFLVYEPKKREVSALRFKDRQAQKSLVQNYLEKEVSRHFIYDNYACQKGRGTSFARKRMKILFLKAYKLWGMNAYAYTFDIRNFFGSTSHNVAKAAIDKRVRDEWAQSMVHQIIDSTPGDVGIGLGSEEAQFVEISVLDGLDHFIKEKLKVRFFGRYMDDFIIIDNGKDRMKEYRTRIEEEVKRRHLELNLKKCNIVPLSKGFEWCGFKYRLTNTGKVIMTVSKHKINLKKRKLRKMVKIAKEGRLTKKDCDESLQSWLAHIKVGNCHNTRIKMIRYYESLWRDEDV